MADEIKPALGVDQEVFGFVFRYTPVVPGIRGVGEHREEQFDGVPANVLLGAVVPHELQECTAKWKKVHPVHSTRGGSAAATKPPLRMAGVMAVMSPRRKNLTSHSVGKVSFSDIK